MVNKPKKIGTATETAVARYLQANGFPGAERRTLRGRNDPGDITGIGPVCIQIKGGVQAETASDGLITAWLTATEQQRVNTNSDVGLLVVKRKGISQVNAGQWWAVMWLSTLLELHWRRETVMPWHDAPIRLFLCDAVRLLRAAGHGDPVSYSLADVTG